LSVIEPTTSVWRNGLYLLKALLALVKVPVGERMSHLPSVHDLANVRTAGAGNQNILGVNAAILINGCNAGLTIHDDLADADLSIAQLISNETQRGVYAFEVGVYFSQSDAAHDRHFDGTDVVNGKKVSRTVPNALPMYPVPAGVPGHKPPPIPFTPK
jgi:hypothetical protein